MPALRTKMPGFSASLSIMQAAPTVIELPYHSDSAEYFSKLSTFKGVAWLDSGEANNRRGTEDILTAEPTRYLTGDVNVINDAVKQLSTNVCFKHLNDLAFTGGAIGYLTYESRHQHFNITSHIKHVRNSWHLYDWALVQQHDKKRCVAIFLPSCEPKKVEKILNVLKQPLSTTHPKETHSSTFKPDTSRQEYSNAFQRIQDYILAGDSYQVNFAQRFSADFYGSAGHAYLQLRSHLSGPYSAYFDTQERQILSFSPEQFIRIADRKAQTKPIKGTAPRGKTPEHDKQLADDLINSEKNHSENLMIVDLLRNDFSKNCLAHSINVQSLCTLESYANVHHLVSTIQGTLNDNISPLSFLYDCFPGGSITGTPKKRAMEIIDELETEARDIYCGSIAYLSTNGRLDSSITIRTLLVEKDKVYCWGGGGIVADSTEEDEYQESLQKVQVLMNALSRNKH